MVIYWPQFHVFEEQGSKACLVGALMLDQGRQMNLWQTQSQYELDWLEFCVCWATADVRAVFGQAEVVSTRNESKMMSNGQGVSLHGWGGQVSFPSLGT